MSGEFTGHLRNSDKCHQALWGVKIVLFANMAEREFVDWWEVQVGAEAAYLASHPSGNATAVMPHEMRSAATISLNHSR
jgi:hypothetical protein